MVVLFHEAQMDESVTEMKARLDGVYHKMLKFEFFFGLCLSIEIFGQTDELATVLQAKDLCAAEGKTAVEAIVKTIKSYCGFFLIKSCHDFFYRLAFRRCEGGGACDGEEKRMRWRDHGEMMRSCWRYHQSPVTLLRGRIEARAESQ